MRVNKHSAHWPGSVAAPLYLGVTGSLAIGDIALAIGPKFHADEEWQFFRRSKAERAIELTALGARALNESASLIFGRFAENMHGILIGILALAFVRLKLLPNIFFAPRKLRVAVFANSEQGRHLHEPKLPFAYHFGCPSGHDTPGRWEGRCCGQRHRNRMPLVVAPL